MKFILSYSAGKDSVLALHKMVESGHEPMGLLVMYNEDAGRSWFHGVDPGLLTALSESLGIPLLCCRASGEAYHRAMEEQLRRAKALGAAACVFGDIDIEQHRRWDEDRCAAAGLAPVLPLWGRDREENVGDAIRLGYHCLIKCVNRSILPESVLGKPLDGDTLRVIADKGADLCGENGEYHTVVVDGPLFRRPVDYTCGEIVRFERISAIDISVGRRGHEGL